MSAESRRRPRRWLTIAPLVVLSILTAALVAVGIMRSQGESDETATGIRPIDPAVTSINTRPTLLVLGDSYAEGVGDPTYRPYPGILADEMGWNLALDAQGGTGFITARNTTGIVGVPFIERLAKTKAAYNPDVIIVDGGRNDLDRPPAEIIPAMDHYLEEVRTAWPEASLVVVVPSYITDVEPASYPAMRNAITEIADKLGAKVIDPVSEGWYRPFNPDWLWRDNVHPGAAGSQYIADRIAGDLRTFGLENPAP